MLHFENERLTLKTNIDMETNVTTTNQPQHDAKLPVICCGVLEKMLIAWMVLEDGTKVMPFIPGDDGNKYRVNNCPSCGTYVRDVQVKP